VAERLFSPLKRTSGCRVAARKRENVAREAARRTTIHNALPVAAGGWRGVAAMRRICPAARGGSHNGGARSGISG